MHPIVYNDILFSHEKEWTIGYKQKPIVTDRSVVKKREGERSTAKGNGELLAMIEIS